ncbi:phage tail terminator family protein [Paenibacillus sp. NPDC093718]|uniref:phage tail terminator family protein n=1 Tax=Paenibacillus sp. NPDC093718 TaxID=3390601 RepID=UPI003D00B989
MLTLKQIVKSITTQLNTKFPEINVTSRDIKEGFERPSFFVEIDNNSSSSGLFVIEKSKTIRIYYFPSDMYENELELLQMQDDLAEVFNLTVKIEDRTITLDETVSVVTDGVLQFEFDLNYLDSNKSTVIGGSGELMKEIEIRKVD